MAIADSHLHFYKPWLLLGLYMIIQILYTDEKHNTYKMQKTKTKPDTDL